MSLRARSRPRPVLTERRPLRAWRAVIPLVLSLLLGSALFGGSSMAVHADNPPNGITVQGDGVAELPPDVAHISGSVDTQAATAADALNQNSQTLNAVIAAVEAAGVADADIQTTRITVFPIFSQPQAPSGGVAAAPVLVGFRASNGINVKTTNLNRVGDLIQIMVNAGITSFNGVAYGLQDPSRLRAMALQAAIADAQAQAQTAATSLGVKLGGVLNFTVQGTSAPPVPRAAAPVAAAAVASAPPPVMPGPLTATTHVTVTFAILGP